MAYVSYGLDRNATSYEPDAITIGTDDGGNGNNVTLCINQAASLNTTDVILICQAFIRRLERGDRGPADLLNI